MSVMLHLLAGLALISFAAPPPAPARRPPPSMPVFVVAPTEDSQFAGLNPVDRSQPDLTVDEKNQAATLAIDRYHFDVAKIASRATLLFPFLTPGLSLEHFGVETSPAVSAFRNVLQSPFGEATPAREKPALALSEKALDSLIDRCWSRRDRWTPFQRVVKLTEEYSPSAGRMPDVLRAYADRDGLQPYADATVRDPRLWAELGLAADHVSFIGFIRNYTSQHPRTKAATELLFLLDQLVQGSLDALLTLLTVDPQRDLQLTRETDVQAYELIVRLRQYYDRQLKRHGVKSIEAVASFFDTVRLEILSRIISTTPDRYRIGDAHYLVGTILWRQRRTAEALGEWARIQVNPADKYVVVSSDLLKAIRSADSPGVDPDGAALAMRIRWILDAERGRWLDFSYERLRQFGYYFNTF